MPRAASPSAMADMNGCAMPAPAPCANTKQAVARGGARRRAETRARASTSMVIGLVFGSDIRLLPLHLLFLLDDLLGLLVQRAAGALRLAARRHLRALAQHVDAGVDALGLLHRDAVAVARADELLHDVDAVGIEADRRKRLVAELHRGLEGLAQLVIDVPREQL